MNARSTSPSVALVTAIALIAASAPASAQSLRVTPAAPSTQDIGRPADMSTQFGFAQGTGLLADVVHMKDGSAIRGTISELREGSHVLVQLDGGQVARIRWDVISRIERAGTVTTPGSAPAPAPSPAPAPAAIPAPPVVQDMVFVHIESPDPVRLERMSGRSGRPVCESPCDIAVPLQGSYRIAGGVRASREFNFSARPGDRVTLSVDPASKGAFAGGIVMVSLGGVSLLVGSLTYLFASLVRSLDKADQDGRGGQTVGVVMMALGVGGLAGGITMMVANRSSNVDQTVGGNGPAPAAAPAQAQRAPREPSVRDGDRHQDVFTAGLPTPFVAPLTFQF